MKMSLIIKNFFSSLQYLRYLDFFQQHVFLKVKGKARDSLLFGRLFSVGIIIFLLYHVLKSDMVKFANPIVLQQLIKSHSRPEINMNEENFIFAFSLSDDASSYLPDPTIFNFQLVERTLIDRIVTSEKFYEHEPCTKDHLKNFPELSVPLQNLSCIKNTNFSLKGYWDEKEITYFSLIVNKCVNTTEKSSCQSEEAINEYFKIRYFEAFLLQKSFDLNNFENPISTSVKSIFTGLELGRRKEVANYIKKTKILSDSQAMFSDFHESETLLFEEGFMDFQKSDESLLIYSFYSSDYTMVFQRRYQKLFELLATLGGILHSLIIFGTAITKVIHGWKINEMIMNKIYALNVKPTPANNKEIIVLTITTPKNNLKLTLWEKIKFLYKSKKKFTPKERIYSTYLEKSNQKLDLFDILGKLEEIERLKYLILNRKQINIFNSFDKKVLVSESETLNSNFTRYTFDRKKLTNFQIQDLMIKVEKMKKDRNASQIDRKLIKIIDGQMN